MNIRVNIAMAKYTKNDVLEVAEAIERAKGKVAFLTGAGCSLTAGIPLAKALVAEIHEKYPRLIERMVESERRNDYGRCMGALPPDQRKTLLVPYFDKAKINWANIALACMIRDGFLRRILTFNFDPVLARACGLLGEYPPTYDFGVSPSDQTYYLADPCVVHLHGQGHGLTMKNSDEETEKHAKLLWPLLKDTLAGSPLVVVGYSGEADRVFDELRAAYSGRQSLYWLGYEEEPKDHLRPLLDGKHKDYCRYIGGADADAFLIALAQKLDCFPPQVFADPAGHLLKEMKEVAEFPLDKTGLTYDLLKESQKRLESEGASLKLDATMLAALRGDAGEISRIERATPAGEKSPVPPQIAAWAHISSGNEHFMKAEAENSAEQYELAARDYEKALALKPDMHEALNNWGSALAGLAKLTGDEDLFRVSITKCEAAHAIKPDRHEALYSWGNALAELAKLTGDEALFREAFAKYQAALVLKPDDHEALNNWGVALAGLARLKGDEALFRNSIAKYQAALAIKPDKHEALDNWGVAIMNLWHRTKDPSLLDEAREALDRHERLNPKKPYNRACLAAILGDEEGCRARLLRAKQFGTLPTQAHLQTDLGLETMRDKPWFKELAGL